MSRYIAPTPAVLEHAQASVRSYNGEHQAHAHAHAQVLFALQGRMELEVGGRASFVDSACGMVIPAGTDHGYLASPVTRVLVIDAPMSHGLDKPRRFAVPPALHFPQSRLSAAAQMALILEAPTLLQRRGLDLQWLQQQVQAALHELADSPSGRAGAFERGAVSCPLCRAGTSHPARLAARPAPGCRCAADQARQRTGGYGFALRLRIGQRSGLCATTRTRADIAPAA